MNLLHKKNDRSGRFEIDNKEHKKRNAARNHTTNLFAAFIFIGCIGCSVFDSGTQGVSANSQTYEETVTVDGEARTFLVHVPDGLSSPAPLVLSFHGKWGQGQDQLRLSGMNDLSDREGFIVVYPDGKNKEWDAGIRQGILKRRLGDDKSFVRAMVRELQQDFNIDSKRIYATGMSNGAAFVHRLACEMPDLIASVAAVAGTIAPSIDASCQPSRPISVLQISGTDDPIVPYGGNLILESVDSTVSGWSARNACSGQPQKRELSGGIEEVQYESCQRDTEVVLYTVDGGGHTWPGGWQYAPVSVVGTTSTAINASETIWRFFEDNPMP